MREIQANDIHRVKAVKAKRKRAVGNWTPFHQAAFPLLGGPVSSNRSSQRTCIESTSSGVGRRYPCGPSLIEFSDRRAHAQTLIQRMMKP